jgi:putative transposase
MPRPTRLNLPNIAQHVVQRGNNRQRCFFSDIDYRLYLKLLGAGCEQHRCHLHAYVLMTNHVHLLITPETPDGVSLLMRDLGRDYVRTINKVHGRSGTLWESRFKSSLVDAYHYCLNCYRYIELNPVRAGMVTHTSQYRWSSFHGNGLGKHDARITPHQVWLALGDTHDERSRRYRNLFGMELGQDTLENIRRGVGTGLPTGSRRFQNEIAKTLSIQFGTGRRGRRPKFRK